MDDDEPTRSAAAHLATVVTAAEERPIVEVHRLDAADLDAGQFEWRRKADLAAAGSGRVRRLAVVAQEGAHDAALSSSRLEARRARGTPGQGFVGTVNNIIIFFVKLLV